MDIRLNQDISPSILCFFSQSTSCRPYPSFALPLLQMSYLLDYTMKSFSGAWKQPAPTTPAFSLSFISRIWYFSLIPLSDQRANYMDNPASSRSLSRRSTTFNLVFPWWPCDDVHLIFYLTVKNSPSHWVASWNISYFFLSHLWT